MEDSGSRQKRPGSVAGARGLGRIVLRTGSHGFRWALLAGVVGSGAMRGLGVSGSDLILDRQIFSRTIWKL